MAPQLNRRKGGGGGGGFKHLFEEVLTLKGYLLHRFVDCVPSVVVLLLEVYQFLFSR